MALSTGGVRQGVVKVFSVFSESTGAVTLCSIPIASNTTVRYDIKHAYQRTNNSDNGSRWSYGLVRRDTGSASVITTAYNTEFDASWGQGGLTATATGSSIKFVVSCTSQPVRYFGTVEVVECKQNVIVS